MEPDARWGGGGGQWGRTLRPTQRSSVSANCTRRLQHTARSNASEEAAPLRSALSSLFRLPHPPMESQYGSDDEYDNDSRRASTAGIVRKKRPKQKPMTEYEKEARELIRTQANELITDQQHWRRMHEHAEVENAKRQQEINARKAMWREELCRGIDLQLSTQRAEFDLQMRERTQFQKEFNESIRLGEEREKKKLLESKEMMRLERERVKKERMASIQQIKERVAKQLVEDREASLRVQAEWAKEEELKKRIFEASKRSQEKVLVENSKRSAIEAVELMKQRDVDHQRNQAMIRKLEAKELEQQMMRQRQAAEQREEQLRAWNRQKAAAAEHNTAEQVERALNDFRERQWELREMREIRTREIFNKIVPPLSVRPFRQKVI